MRIYLDTIGCRLNQAEIEQMAHQFRMAGHVIVSTASDADLAVVNTCAVTSEAASDSRRAIRHIQRLGVQEIIATGCWATLEPALAAGLPGITRIIPNRQKDSLVAELFGLQQAVSEGEPLARRPLPGLRSRTRAFIKAQEGCDNACTYCLATIARGGSHSLPAEAIHFDVKAALAGGAKEVILTGVHLGAWGQDLMPARSLRDLVSGLLGIASLPRLRLSSLEPWDLKADFFNLWSNPAICRHLHLPLQSGSPAVLRRMARKTTPRSFSALLNAALSQIPDVAITTDVIVGFPGETETEFNESLDFVRSMGFAGGHVFTFSARPGTPAAGMAGQLHGDVTKIRSALMRKVFSESARGYRRKFLGQEVSVLWESTNRLNDTTWRLEGWTGNYIRVTACASGPRWNVIDRVNLFDEVDDGLIGVISNS